MLLKNNRINLSIFFMKIHKSRNEKRNIVPRVLLIIFPFIFIFIHNGISQLPSFTQYQQNQLNINPAFASYFDDDIKWNGLYRSQSYSELVTSTFLNSSLQMRPYFSFIGDNDEMGFGLNTYSNKSLNVYSHQALSATLSYGKGLNADASQFLTVGFQGRYNTKRTDYTQLLFPNQFDVTGYTYSLPNNEPIQTTNINYIEMNTGIMYKAENDFEAFLVGLGMYNLNQPTNYKSGISMRYEQTYNFHLGYSRFTSENSELFLGVLFSSMGKQNATSVVAAFQFYPDPLKSIGLQLGAINNINNGISPFLTLGIGQFKTCFTYNIPINPKISYINNNKSFELGLQLLFSKYSESNSMARKHMSCF
jgi:type IX secretion system PorP/SprF family membrane protein